MKKYILWIMSIILLLSCEKENTIDEPYFIINSENTSLSIKTLYRGINSPLVGGSSYSMEIENICKLNFGVSNREGQLSSFVIYNITNSVEVAVLEVNDTIFKCHSLYNDTTVHEITYNKQSSFECSDSIEIIDSLVLFYPLMLKDGDTLSDRLKWVNINSKPHYLSYRENSLYQSNTIDETNIKHGLWEYDELSFLCFRYLENEKFKYFLIEMEIDANDKSTLFIHRLFY